MHVDAIQRWRSSWLRARAARPHTHEVYGLLGVVVGLLVALGMSSKPEPAAIAYAILAGGGIVGALCTFAGARTDELLAPSLLAVSGGLLNRPPSTLGSRTRSRERNRRC